MLITKISGYNSQTKNQVGFKSKASDNTITVFKDIARRAGKDFSSVDKLLDNAYFNMPDTWKKAGEFLSKAGILVKRTASGIDYKEAESFSDSLNLYRTISLNKAGDKLELRMSGTLNPKNSKTVMTNVSGEVISFEQNGKTSSTILGEALPAGEFPSNAGVNANL